MLAYPPASVRWKKHPLFPIYCHRLIFGTVCALALLTGQVAFAIGSNREENQKCEDPNSGLVGDSGVCTCFNGYQHSNGACEVDEFGKSQLRVSIDNEEVYASFEGSYGSDALDGTFDQDFLGGVVGGPKEDSITMFGNAWKIYRFQEQLTIKKSTILTFDFEASEKSEGNAICLEEDRNEDTYGGLKTRCIAIIINDGTNQVDEWSNVIKVPVNGDGDRTYSVNVGDLFNDQETQVQYLAFIQDNDISPLEGKSTFSNVTIYEDTSSSSLSLTWTPVDKRDKVVSTRSGPVSVSEDGNVAIYGSSGNLHLLKKDSSKSCKVNFPGCKVAQWNVLKYENSDLSGRFCWKNDGHSDKSGYSSKLLQGFHGLNCSSEGYCTYMKLLHFQSEEVFDSQQYYWTQWNSKERHEYCKNNMFVSQIQCGDSHCRKMRFLCMSLMPGYRSEGETMVTGWFSGDTPTGHCTKGFFVNGIICGNHDCTELKLQCQKIEKYQHASLVYNDWPDYYALPSPEQLPSSPNKCPHGTDVPQIECHLAGITVQKQFGLNINLKVLHQSRNPTTQPCGCFIWDMNDIVFNSNSSCKHHEDARLVCKSRTKSPTRTPDITISPPEEIGSGYRFGEGAKVLSYDGNEIAIAAPGASKIAVYSLAGSTSTLKDVIHGYNPAISSDGEFIGVASAKSGSSDQCNIDLFAASQPRQRVFTNAISCNVISEGITITLQDDFEGIWLDTKDVSYNLSCSDSNAKLVTQSNISPVICLCNDGFVNSGPDGGMQLQDTYSCISSLRAYTVVVTADSVQFSMPTDLMDSYPTMELLKKSQPNDISVTLTKNKLEQTNRKKTKQTKQTKQSRQTKQTASKLKHLEPGSRYIVSLVNNAKTDKISFPVVTTCSCGSDHIDKTGRPDIVSVTQRNGHVMFTFTDNSLCEEGFSFTRSDYAEEFLADVSTHGVAFTRDYYFIGGRDCNSTISTGTDASDNLAYSNLSVGMQYLYCVRAVHSSHYMDHPLDSLGEGRRMESSDDSCAPHKIHWEASIHGKITTEPNAGSLPMKNVTVTYSLMNEDEESPIECDKCSGIEQTTEGGSFYITFNVDNPFLKDKNDADLPVKIKFSKKSGDISHKFLCNEGEDDCSGDTGTVVYLKHLNFKEPVHVYDDTSIPFSGKVFIADTKYSGSEGCELSNVEVCLVQERNYGGVTKTNETLVCGETDKFGAYSLPVIIGSRVDYVDLMYHDHAFRSSSESKFVDGMMIKENEYYGDNDFEDFEKARVVVEIVGGLCDRPLGTSEVHMQIDGCEWNKYNPRLPHPQTHMQSGERKVYNNVPAHGMKIQVLDLFDSESNSIDDIVSKFFQPARPLVRTIDLRDTSTADKNMEEAEESQNVPTSKGIEKDDKLRNQAANSFKDIEKSEEEGMELVRFQYDGELTMDVVISNDELTCTNYNLEKDYDSLHVLEYMTGFSVTVRPKYTIIKDQLYCDIMDDDLKLHITSNVGKDFNKGFEEFLKGMRAKDEAAANLLEKCSDTGCQFDIDHAIDGDGKKSGAIVSEYFATGRPNTASPYTKSMIFSIRGGTSTTDHTAAIVVGGYFSNGPGNSFALPTHKPIMVLRDPPGGLSYATYENVKTTIALETSSSSTTVHHHFGLNLKSVIDVDAEFCYGGGLGVVSLGCNKLAEGSHKVQLFGYEHDAGGIVSMEEKTRSTEFTTTWSYATSSDPWTAGAMSDIFIVPNLDVMYREVQVIHWDNEMCAVEESDGALPETTTINLEDGENQQSLAFYSRYHVEYVKLPELRDSAKNIETVRTSADCDCDNQDEEFMCPFGDDEEASCSQLDRQVTYLNNAIVEWNEYLLPKKDFKSNSIVNWFEEVGSEIMKDENDLEINDHSSALASSTLLSGAEEVNNVPKKENDDDTNLEAMKRIQFSGGGSTFSMTLSKEKMWDDVGLSCWDGCNSEYENKVSGPGLDEVQFLIMGIGLETQILPFNLKIHAIHESTKEETDTESTSIGFTLGDSDPGDEFVVDLYYDEKFGTVIFDPVAGRSKCPYEVGTLAIEDPSLEIYSLPSPNVFPDEDMVFEMKMKNLGVGDESQFVLYMQQRDNPGGLDVLLDGVSLFNSRSFSNILKSKSYKKTLVIKRGPRMFQYPPIVLTFESACLDENSQINDLTAAIFNENKSVSLTLYNRGAGENAAIEFLKECPEVEWAGELKRDRHFVVNTNSDDQNNLQVTIFNQYHGENTFNEMTTTDRLESVILYYRELGDLQQFTYKAKVEVEINGRTDSLEVDFAADYADESDYGYTTMKWALANKVQEGRYEIMVEAACEHIKNAPDPINMFRTPVLTGVIDLTRPEKYGKELPLRDQVFVGEEISVIFSEPLLCQKPFTFDLKVIIEETDYAFDREDLQVVCEGRRIGFQIDPSVVNNVEDILGKKFSVELGRIGSDSVSNIYDVNGNGLDPSVGNIKFKKKLGELNLQEASSSFVLTLNDYACVDNTKDDIKTKVASILGLTSTGRITLNAVTCHGTTAATAKVVISPPSSVGERMLRKRPSLEEEEEEDHSVGLFYQLRDAALEVAAGTRKLSFEGEEVNALAWSFAVSQMNIFPSASDIEMLKTDLKLIEEEENLLHLASLDDTGDTQKDMILQELRMGLKHEDEKMEEIQNHGDEKMEAIQKYGDEKMEAMMTRMQKQNADEKAIMQKREDEKMEAMMAAMQKHDAEEEAMMLNEMHSLQNQFAVMTLACMIVSVAVFFKLKN